MFQVNAILLLFCILYNVYIVNGVLGGSCGTSAGACMDLQDYTCSGCFTTACQCNTVTCGLGTKYQCMLPKVSNGRQLASDTVVNEFRYEIYTSIIEPITGSGGHSIIHIGQSSSDVYGVGIEVQSGTGNEAKITAYGVLNSFDVKCNVTDLTLNKYSLYTIMLGIQLNKLYLSVNGVEKCNVADPQGDPYSYGGSVSVGIFARGYNRGTLASYGATYKAKITPTKAPTTKTPTTAPTKAPTAAPTKLPTTKTPTTATPTSFPTTFPTAPTSPPDTSSVLYVSASFNHQIIGVASPTAIQSILNNAFIDTTCATTCSQMGSNCVGFHYQYSGSSCYFFKEIYTILYSSSITLFNSRIFHRFNENKYVSTYTKYTSSLCNVGEYVVYNLLAPTMKAFYGTSDVSNQCKKICDSYSTCIGFETYEWVQSGAYSFLCLLIKRFSSGIVSSSITNNSCYIKTRLASGNTVSTMHIGNNPLIDFDIILYTTPTSTQNEVFSLGTTTNKYPIVTMNQNTMIVLYENPSDSFLFNCTFSHGMVFGKKYSIKLQFTTNNIFRASIDNFLLCSTSDVQSDPFIPPIVPQIYYASFGTPADAGIYNFITNYDAVGMRCEYGALNEVAGGITLISNGFDMLSNPINCREQCNSLSNCVGFTIFITGGTCSFFSAYTSESIVANYKSYRKLVPSCFNSPTSSPTTIMAPTTAPTFGTKKSGGQTCAYTVECSKGLYCDSVNDFCLAYTCDFCSCNLDESCSDFRFCRKPSQFAGKICKLRSTNGNYCESDDDCDAGIVCKYATIDISQSGTKSCSATKTTIPSSPPSRSPTPLATYASGCGSSDFTCGINDFCHSNQCVPYSAFASSCNISPRACPYNKICAQVTSSQYSCETRNSRTEDAYCRDLNGDYCADGFFCKNTQGVETHTSSCQLEWRVPYPAALQLNDGCNPNTYWPDCTSGLTCQYFANTGHICQTTPNPTTAPTKTPTLLPTKAPTKFPTPPTKAPTLTPTKAPTQFPTKLPTKSPTFAPTFKPTQFPTKSPTVECFTESFNSQCSGGIPITVNPTIIVTEFGECELTCRNNNQCNNYQVRKSMFTCTLFSSITSITPSTSDFECHSKIPSCIPTKEPSKAPSKVPSFSPTKTPSVAPTKFPTAFPTAFPTFAPTKALGSICTSNSECFTTTPDKYCDSYTNLCTLYATPGQICNAGTGKECGFGYFCVFTFSTDTTSNCLVSKQSTGQECKFNNDCQTSFCVFDDFYYPTKSKCVNSMTPLNPFSVCNQADTRGCVTGYACRTYTDNIDKCLVTLAPSKSPTTQIPTLSPTPPTFAPTKEPTTSFPTNAPTNPTNSPTSGFNGPCNGDYDCRTDLHCSSFPDNKCYPYLLYGSECDRPRQCDPSSYCGYFTSVAISTKLCFTKKPYQGLCYDNDSCASGLICLLTNNFGEKRCLDSYRNGGSSCGPGGISAPYCNPLIHRCIASFLSLGNFFCTGTPTPRPTSKPTTSKPTRLPTLAPTTDHPTSYYNTRINQLTLSVEENQYVDRISISEDVAVVGISYLNKVVIFQHDKYNNVWNRFQTISAPINGSSFGKNLYISNGILAIGAPDTDIINYLTVAPTPPTKTPTKLPTRAPVTSAPTNIVYKVLDAYETCETNCADIGNVVCAGGLTCTHKMDANLFYSKCNNNPNDNWGRHKVCISSESGSGSWGDICGGGCGKSTTKPCRFGLTCGTTQEKKDTTVSSFCTNLMRCKLKTTKLPTSKPTREPSHFPTFPPQPTISVPTNIPSPKPTLQPIPKADAYELCYTNGGTCSEFQNSCMDGSTCRSKASSDYDSCQTNFGNFKVCVPVATCDQGCWGSQCSQNSDCSAGLFCEQTNELWPLQFGIRLYEGYINRCLKSIKTSSPVALPTLKPTYYKGILNDRCGSTPTECADGERVYPVCDYDLKCVDSGVIPFCISGNGRAFTCQPINSVGGILGSLCGAGGGGVYGCNTNTVVNPYCGVGLNCTIIENSNTNFCSVESKCLLIPTPAPTTKAPTFSSFGNVGDMCGSTPPECSDNRHVYPSCGDGLNCVNSGPIAFCLVGDGIAQTCQPPGNGGTSGELCGYGNIAGSLYCGDGAFLFVKTNCNTGLTCTFVVTTDQCALEYKCL